MKKLILLIFAAIGVAFAGLSGRENAQTPPAAPPPPLAAVTGASVSLAWRLPSEKPLPVKVVIYRRTWQGTFGVIATLEAAQLSYTDATVSVGETYEYGIAYQLRDRPLSAISDPVKVNVGDTARVVFRGGSITRAIFDISAYSEGRKFVETFVHAPGEDLGDLRHVEGVNAALDFRLGARLATLRLEFRPGKSVAREPLLDATGASMKDLAGRVIEMDWPAKSEVRERLVAEVTLRDGSKLTLTEGEGFTP